MTPFHPRESSPGARTVSDSGDFFRARQYALASCSEANSASAAPTWTKVPGAVIAWGETGSNLDVTA